jgi:hypothetical protein
MTPNNSDNDVQLVEPVKDTTTSEIATDITETPIQHARKRWKKKTSQFLGQHQTKLYMEVDL